MGLFKSIKKRFKKLGSSIAKRMRKIGRGVKKGFSKITKAFGKLGPLGQIALFFILPGMGNVLGSWMGQFGSKVMNMLPSNFSKVLIDVGSKIKTAASYVTDPIQKSIGTVYNTVSKALTGGIDAVTKPFMGPSSEGLATSFKNFVSETATKFSPTPDTLTDTEITQLRKDSSAEIFEKIDSGAKLPKDSAMDAAKKAQAAGMKDTAAAKARAKELGIDVPEPKTIKTIDTPEIKEDGIFRKGIDELSKLKTTVGDATVLGTGVEVREVASVAKDASGVFSAYKYFNPDNVEGSFYNPNIGMANQLNNPNDPYTMGGSDATFIPMNASSNMNSAASAYAGIFGNPGPDPISTAIGAPGYGLSFGDYATGGTYG